MVEPFEGIALFVECSSVGIQQETSFCAKRIYPLYASLCFLSGEERRKGETSPKLNPLAVWLASMGRVLRIKSMMVPSVCMSSHNQWSFTREPQVRLPSQREVSSIGWLSLNV